ncbi:hypothetical protein CTI12_AA143440 [Artemisia annua]|uniref:Uncharacterized protein n=1 Tax=Artemisia annua TaxID=35608 RepID=A0A2U1PJM3_ARTAN|nr:hypothetical protein CTI12_AA143440 [Artemisia annua]
MERSEPTFVPEWLKTSSSASHSDDQSVPKVVRNKSLVNGGDKDLGRSNSSSFFRRANGSNGGAHLRAYSSFGRNRDRDWDRDRERNENRHRDYSDPFRFEKDGLRRSYSNLSAKRGESWPRKVVGERNGHNNNKGKISFERDFPSLGAEEKHMDCEIGRVTSPGLTSAIQSLPVGNSGGDVWTSALAEVPVMVGSNGPTSTAKPTQESPVCESLSHTEADETAFERDESDNIKYTDQQHVMVGMSETKGIERERKDIRVISS